jgi:hypothetical protein
VTPAQQDLRRRSSDAAAGNKYRVRQMRSVDGRRRAAGCSAGRALDQTDHISSVGLH